MLGNSLNDPHGVEDKFRENRGYEAFRHRYSI